MSMIFTTMFERIAGFAQQMWEEPTVKQEAWIEGEDPNMRANCSYKIIPDWLTIIRGMLSQIPELLEKAGLTIRHKADTAEESLDLMERFYLEAGVFTDFALGEEVQVSLKRAARFFEINENNLDLEIAKIPSEFDYLSRLQSEMERRLAEAEKRKDRAKTEWEQAKARAFFEAKQQKSRITNRPVSNEEAKANAEVAPAVLEAKEHYYECWQEVIDKKRGVDRVYSDVKSMNKKNSQLYSLVQLKTQRDKMAPYVRGQED